MKTGNVIYPFLILSLFSCSVDYSVLEERFCNSQNQCIEGYKCDLATGKCIKSPDSSDISFRDIISDIDSGLTDLLTEDVKDDTDDRSYSDTYQDIISDIKDTGYPDISNDSGLCETGIFTCRDNDLYRCDENGLMVLEKSCEMGCKNDHCIECLPNEKVCTDEENLRICNQEGLFESQKCTYKCYNNQCVICLPTDKYCNGKKALKCNPIGTKWEEKDCEIGCSAGECMICEPEVTKKCVDNDIYTCTASGMDYSKTQNCCHENNCTDGNCVITAPRVTDYNPKDWKVGGTIYWDIYGCFFVSNASKVMIDFGGSWKEITEYDNYEYSMRTEERIQIKVKVLTGTEFNFKVVNPDGQSTQQYPIKKHY